MRVADMVRSLIPFTRNRLSQAELELGVYLRGNTPLYECLVGIIKSRISGRGSAPVPTDPIACKAMLERDRELQWLLSRLELIYRAPVAQPEQESEHPA